MQTALAGRGEGRPCPIVSAWPAATAERRVALRSWGRRAAAGGPTATSEPDEDLVAVDPHREDRELHARDPLAVAGGEVEGPGVERAGDRARLEIPLRHRPPHVRA